MEKFREFSVADPGPGSGAFLTPGSGIRDGQKSASGSGIWDEQPGSYFLELRNHFFWVKTLKFFDADPGSGIRDGDSSDPGSGMEKRRIRDPGSATLREFYDFFNFFLFLFRYCTEIFDYLSLSAIIDGKVGSCFSHRILICLQSEELYGL